MGGGVVQGGQESRGQGFEVRVLWGMEVRSLGVRSGRWAFGHWVFRLWAFGLWVFGIWVFGLWA